MISPFLPSVQSVVLSCLFSLSVAYLIAPLCAFALVARRTSAACQPQACCTGGQLMMFQNWNYRLNSIVESTPAEFVLHVLFFFLSPLTKGG